MLVKFNNLCKNKTKSWFPMTSRSVRFAPSDKMLFGFSSALVFIQNQNFVTMFFFKILLILFIHSIFLLAINSTKFPKADKRLLSLVNGDPFYDDFDPRNFRLTFYHRHRPLFLKKHKRQRVIFFHHSHFHHHVHQNLNNRVRCLWLKFVCVYFFSWLQLTIRSDSSAARQPKGCGTSEPKTARSERYFGQRIGRKQRQRISPAKSKLRFE